MKTSSQAGQDIFCRLIFGPDYVGTFLDVGCAGDQWSNTLALENEGWRGTLLDIDPNAGNRRKSKFICADACTHKWELPPYIDYLSLDVDENSLNALKNLPLNTTRFGVITIENDKYRFGDKLWPFQKDILKSYGYELICEDVCGAPNAPFESWWVTHELLPKAEKFKCVGKLYSDILIM